MNFKKMLFFLFIVVAFSSIAQRSEKLKKWEYPKHQHALELKSGFQPSGYLGYEEPNTSNPSISPAWSSFFDFKQKKGFNAALSYNYSWNIVARLKLITGVKVSLFSGNSISYNFDGHYIDSIPYYSSSSDGDLQTIKGVAPFGAQRNIQNTTITPAISVPLKLGYSWEFENGFMCKVNLGVSANYVFNRDFETIIIKDYIEDVHQDVMYYDESSNPNHRINLNLNIGAGIGFISKKGYPIYFNAYLYNTIYNENKSNRALIVLPNQPNKTITQSGASRNVPFFSVGLEIGLVKLKKI